jgi:leader peptidase (prepilin peptidase)/N-methyltransferase
MLAFIDVAQHRLPDPLTLPSYPIGAALFGIAVPFTDDGGTRYLHALTGLGALLLLFAVQWFIAPNAIGLGDVKLSGVLGLYLGWLGWSAWTMGVFAMFLSGGVFALGLLVTRRATRKSTIPFGPFMLVGALAAVVHHAGGL